MSAGIWREGIVLQKKNLFVPEETLNRVKACMFLCFYLNMKSQNMHVSFHLVPTFTPS